MSIRHIAALAILAFLAACGGEVVRDRAQIASIPVVQPCAGPRPATVKPLLERYTDDMWSSMDLVQKLAVTGLQALDRQDYGNQLNAATAACP